jgi:hypothetical protein
MCSPQLSVPDMVRIPGSTPHLDQAAAAFERYRDYSSNPKPVTWHDFELIWKYCDQHGDVGAIQLLYEEDIQGYTIFLHELTELRYYFQEGLDPYNRPLEPPSLERKAYITGNSRALIAEHRYLQDAARVDGWHFSLKALILYNPGSVDPKQDWQCVEDGGHQLSEFDQSLPSEPDEVLGWYRSKGFMRDYLR